jgi:thioredoxin reductase
VTAAEDTLPSEPADVVVVGAGPAGLAAAVELRRLGAARVVVLDREPTAGGIPRHSDHPGYGVRDLGRVLSGPGYARRWAELAEGSGAEVRVSSTVTALDPGTLRLEVTSPQGRYALSAGAVVLATGCRERPRSARLLPGDRPAGVYTTGWLQQLVHLQHRSPGTRAVVVGAEHVSFSAVRTLGQGGCDTVAMVTSEPGHTSFAAFHLGARGRYRFPLLASSRVTAVNGHGRVESVDVAGQDGSVRRIPCDTVVLTGDWVPDNELARWSGVPVDDGTRGPVVDAALRTPVPGVFAVGNLVHAAETADVCALDGRHVGAAVLAHLLGSAWPAHEVHVEVEPPLLWVAPQRVSTLARPARGRVLLRTSTRLRLARLEVRQGSRLLWSGRIAQGVPTRSLSIPSGWIGAVDPTGGPVVVRLG